MRTHVAIVGGTGMLGAMIVDVFARDAAFAVTATARSASGHAEIAGVTWRALDAETATRQDCVRAIEDADWVVNCIGITKPLIADDDQKKVERAIRVNSTFPHLLAVAAEETGARVLQIATDCVYSGQKGNYTESDAHDALDVYGKSKSLGEVPAKNFFNLRASIIGPEPKDFKFLLEWFLRQSRGASVNGFTNHDWNGVTTLHFARAASGIVSKNLSLPSVHHLVPADRLTKAAMLRSFARAYRRSDIKINDVAAGYTIDRTLATRNQDVNEAIWRAAGYVQPPSLDQMFDEMAAFEPRFGSRPSAKAS